MNLIGLVLTIVLMALISTVGYFYGGPVYTNSRTNAEIAKLQDDFNQLASAFRLANTKGVLFESGVIQEDLISSGIMVDAPLFNGNAYEFWGAGGREMENAPDGYTHYAFIAVSGLSESLCKDINSKNKVSSGFNSFDKIAPPSRYYLEANGVWDSQKINVSALPNMICFKDGSLEPESGDGSKNKFYALFAMDKKEIKEYVSVPQ